MVHAWKACGRKPSRVRVPPPPPMKVIFLNCWYAKAGKAFFDFVKTNSLNIDIFCFQEVDSKLFKKLSNLLSSHSGYFGTDNKLELLGHVYGQTVFVKKDLKVLSSGKVDLYRQVIDDVGFMQYLELKVGSKKMYLANIHGKARPGHKLDTPGRLRQSAKIIDYFKNKKGLKIIGGDFNLLPQTKSAKLFESAGYRNLIKDLAVKTTRNRLSWESLKNGEEKQYFADYVFASSDVKVSSFEVPDCEISDHLPLILDFEV